MHGPLPVNSASRFATISGVLVMSTLPLIECAACRLDGNAARKKELPHMIQMNELASEKIVVQFGARTVKGYLDAPAWNTLEELLSNAPPHAPDTFRIRHADSNVVEDVRVKDVKAVFYVHSFEGNSQHKNLNFHTLVPTVHGIWMRLQFLDGEVMEGIVFNSIRYLVDPGFFLLPSDPHSNNKLVYVVKSCLADHRVLGLRKIPT